MLGIGSTGRKEGGKEGKKDGKTKKQKGQERSTVSNQPQPRVLAFFHPFVSDSTPLHLTPPP